MRAPGPCTFSLHVIEGWRPRVRKLGRDGKVTILVTVAAEPSESGQKKMQDA